MAVKQFETNLHPVDSARGFGVVILSALGFLGYFAASSATHATQSRNFALPAFLALFAFFGAFAMHFSFRNFAADKDQHRYRYFNSILGFSVGSWQALPAVTGVVMKYFSDLPIARSRGWQVQQFQAYWVVMLSTGAANHQGIIVHKFSYRDKEKAKKLTFELAKYLGVEPHFFLMLLRCPS